MNFKNIGKYFSKIFSIKKYFTVSKQNKIVIDTFLKKTKIRIKGVNNSIVISSAKIKKMKLNIEGNNNSIVFHNNVILNNLHIIIQGNGHTVDIGEKTEIGSCTMVCCGNVSKIVIGNDCMFASNINLKTCDGHPIYNKNNIINSSKDILIKDHVWVGENVIILKGAKIYENTVVGINSLVTAKGFKAGVILGGIPAKILKEDITWKR